MHHRINYELTFVKTAEMIHKWRTFSRKEKLLFSEALFFLFMAKAILLVLPFKRIVRLSTKKKYWQTDPDSNLLILIQLAIGRANRAAFWKNRCLVQTLAARWMLNRRGIASTVSLGLRFDQQKKLVAHAWISVKDLEIVKKGDDYVKLLSF